MHILGTVGQMPIRAIMGSDLLWYAQRGEGSCVCGTACVTMTCCPELYH